MKSKDDASGNDRAAGMVEANTQDRISVSVVDRCTLGGVVRISAALAQRLARGELNDD